MLSTVCGGAQGRIAWAGPDEFWTISDQRPGQIVTAEAEYGRVSLCHFKERQGRGLLRDAAQPAQLLPADECRRVPLPGKLLVRRRTRQPAQHGRLPPALGRPRDDGRVLARGPRSLLDGAGRPGHAVRERLAEGRRRRRNPLRQRRPQPPRAAAPDRPARLERRLPQPADAQLRLRGERILRAAARLRHRRGRPAGGTGDAGAVLALGSDYTPSRSSPAPPQLWAVAGPYERAEAASSGAGVAHPLALRYASRPAHRRYALDAGDRQRRIRRRRPLRRRRRAAGSRARTGRAGGVDHAAHRRRPGARRARQRRRHRSPSSEVLGEAQGVGRRGNAGPIACPAANDCWLATTKGWLFHYTTESEAEPQLPEDTDPQLRQRHHLPPHRRRRLAAARRRTAARRLARQPGARRPSLRRPCRRRPPRSLQRARSSRACTRTCSTATSSN